MTFFHQITIARMFFDVLVTLIANNSDILLRNNGQIQRIIELVMIYFMFAFGGLTSNIIEKQLHCSRIDMAPEFSVHILIIYTLIGCVFDVFFVSLCNNSDLLPYKNEQLQQISELDIIY